MRAEGLGVEEEAPVIGAESKFYGYVTGLWIEAAPECSPEIPKRLFASFEYNGKTTIWEVPDEELFKILSGHLNSMAWIRKNTDEWGYDKLYIEATPNGWVVELP